MARRKQQRFETLEEALWSRVDRSAGADECWPFTGCTALGSKPSRGRPGYGGFTFQAGKYTAHRLAWSLANGPIPDGMWVLHRCDNPPCCNPAHLFLGTVRDNVSDMWAKGRARPRARLPEEKRVCRWTDCGRPTWKNRKVTECEACWRTGDRNGRHEDGSPIRKQRMRVTRREATDARVAALRAQERSA